VATPSRNTKDRPGTGIRRPVVCVRAARGSAPAGP
jgi:hypothetical protein